jgi:hypothetical protein
VRHDLEAGGGDCDQGADDDESKATCLGGDNKFDISITDFSRRYADQNELDYQAFVDAIRSGRVPAVEGI